MNWKYIHPATCQIGQRYYWEDRGADGRKGIREVRFVSYRPHPGEVTIDDGDGPRVIRRLDLYQRIPHPPQG